MRAAVAAAALAIGLGLSSGARAADWWVDGLDGSDANDGHTQAAALKTIGGAHGKAATGDTIYVQQGSYKESVRITTQCLTFKAVGEVILEPDSTHDWSFRVSNWKPWIEGFTFRGGNPCIYNDGYECTVRNCTFRNLQLAIYPYGRHTIEGCLFVDVGDYALFNHSGLWTVRNCTFANCQYGYYGNGGTTDLTNCLFYNCAIPTRYVRGTADFNAFFGTGAQNAYYLAYSPVGGHDVTADPKLVDPDRHLFYVKSDSPLLNAGAVVNGRVAHIGAFGVGAVAAAKETFANTAGDFSNFHSWFEADATGALLAGAIGSTGSAFQFDGAGNLQLKPLPVGAGTIVSPVVDAGAANSFLRAFRYDATENESEFAAGNRRRVGLKNVRTPTVEFRASPISFTHDASAADFPWSPAARNEALNARQAPPQGQFFQVRIQLSREAQ